MPVSSNIRPKSTSDDPVRQIRNLIRDLDAELLQLTGKNQKNRSLSRFQTSKQQIQNKVSKQQIQSQNRSTSILQNIIKPIKSQSHLRKLSKSHTEIKKSTASNGIRGPSFNVSRSVLTQPNKSLSKQSFGNTTHVHVPTVNISRAVLIPPYRSVSKQSLTHKATNNLIPYESISRNQRLTLNAYRAKVVEAYRNRRIFTVFGNYHTIRRCLFNRAWIEKLPPGRFHKYQCLPEDQLLHLAKPGNEFEAVILSRLVKDFPAFFVWQGRGQRDLYADVLPYRNRIRRGRSLDFTTKIGLIGCTQHEHWYNQDDLSHMNYPRVYRLSGNYEEQLAFIDDFRLTQCRSLIRFVNEKINQNISLTDEEFGTVDFAILHFALNNIKSQFKDKENDMIDNVVDNNKDRSPETWKNFMVSSKLILKSNAKFKAKSSQLVDFSKTASEVMLKFYEKCPEYKWDGVRNLWILKPGYSCRGIGILIRSSLDDILQIAKSNPNRYYIAQKYIERPLLIYKTKFDIRQYLLVVINDVNVTLWLYKDCYFRFSSQEYNIEDLRESIHITNNCVQRKYRNKADRDKRLPQNNMWSLEEFKNYLKIQNKPENFWNNHIFKGMKENLTAVVMASMEDTNFIPNSFEMYGCDFMLSEDFRPILIEINATPDLTPSTSVTKRLCPNALRDVIKVVVDVPRNPQAPTGLFEKVFTINYRTNQNFDPKVGLFCSGKQMTLLDPKNTHMKARSKINTRNLISIQSESQVHSNQHTIAKIKSKTNMQNITSPHLEPNTQSSISQRPNISTQIKPALDKDQTKTKSKVNMPNAIFIQNEPSAQSNVAQQSNMPLQFKITSDKDLIKKDSFRCKFLKSFKKLKCPLRRIKKEVIDETIKSTMEPVVRSQLKSMTKEALALQYTTPL